MYIFVIILHLFVSLVLIASILLQAGKGGGLSEAFTGVSPTKTIFGASATTFLTRATTACAVLPGFVADATDCDDGNDQVWALPGEAGNLRFSDDKVSLTWNAPSTLGGTTVLYDTLRSENPGDFESVISCIEQDDGSDTTAMDAESPPAGVAYYYLVGAENGCGRGPLGTNSTGGERSAGACP